MPILIAVILFFVKDLIDVQNFPDTSYPMKEFPSSFDPKEFPEDFNIKKHVKDCDNIYTGGRVALVPRNSITTELYKFFNSTQ